MCIKAFLFLRKAHQDGEGNDFMKGVKKVDDFFRRVLKFWQVIILEIF